ncbi:hypothetical protein CAOG_08072 [Capsaspora owczarzaki ATCC 30864]|uniref:Major facilitator superfamily (MFS) profile domain-containing protein n=1 Tax=Capsaspora owczarzaki (strain ATCC 30864) TaxID=595528 RepID=A0A0D2X5L7_CAPO3|nr:hypothetical protein CAOG_08072 [Capsaspora owczarzaki ATCC 30864]KJE98029.1 hypothetical protein CAOG_008072 [Capsaspora owczarzaki ATCC 30864]|eukprot:XP_004342673.2 hypothetical protein CAOG_08072 [Capsaspora owczarzaki ATCC 30864]
MPSRTFSLRQAVDYVGNGRFQLQLLLITGATQLADAMELMLLPFLTNAVRCDASDAMAASEPELALLSSVVFMGMLLGACSAGWIADVFGRRYGFLLTTACCAIAGAGSAVAWSFNALLLARFVVGFGVGGSPAALSLYAEFIPSTAVRARQLLVFLSFFSIGTLLEACIAVAVLPSYGWRGLLWASAVPSALLLAIAVVFPKVLPESPRLLLTGVGAFARDAAAAASQAKAVFDHAAQVNGRPFPADWELVLSDADTRDGDGAGSDTHDDYDHHLDADNAALLQISAPGTTTPRKQANPIRLLLSSENPLRRRQFALLCGMYFLMALLYYGLVIFTVTLAAASDSPSSSSTSPSQNSSTSSNECGSLAGREWEVILENAGELPGLLLADQLLNRIGRRKTIASLFTLCGGLLMLLLLPEIRGANAGAVLSIIMCVVRMSALGFNQSLWVFTTELFPTNVRASALGVASGFARIGGMVSPFVAQMLFATSATASLCLCIGVSFASALLIHAVPTETASRQLS